MLVLAAILSEIVTRLDPKYSVMFIPGQQDVDLVIYGPDLLALAEVKASPLVVYALKYELNAPITKQCADGSLVEMDDHSNVTMVLDSNTTLKLYLPHIGVEIPLGAYHSPSYPFDATRQFITDPKNLLCVADAWRKLYDLYQETDEENGSHDNGERKPQPRRSFDYYLMCGCGDAPAPSDVNIDDSKAKPGFDRTDDLKKGVYQVLKYGAVYGKSFRSTVLRTILAGNIHAVRHHADYLKCIDRIVWTSQDNVKLSGNGKALVRNTHNLYNMYDALIALTQSYYNDFLQRGDVLKRITSIDRLQEFMLHPNPR